MGLLGHMGQPDDTVQGPRLTAICHRTAIDPPWQWVLLNCRHCHHPVGVAVWQVGWHQGSQGFCQ